MSYKRILIVDDDQAILHLLKRSLKKLGSEYQVITAREGFEALDLIEQETFDLVVADYMMPGMTGIDLARAVRHISPHTQVVLMTAYGTSRLRETIKYLGLDGYVDKPFTLDEIYEVVKNAAELADEDKTRVEAMPSGPGETSSVRGLLQTLYVNTNARFVLLLRLDEKPVQVIGQASQAVAASVGEFVATNYRAAQMLAQQLNTPSIFNSSYNEGDDYNIYTCEVNDQFLLAIVFEARQKPGVVWFYTRQAATKLAQLLENSELS